MPKRKYDAQDCFVSPPCFFHSLRLPADSHPDCPKPKPRKRRRIPRLPRLSPSPNRLRRSLRPPKSQNDEGEKLIKPDKVIALENGRLARYSGIRAKLMHDVFPGIYNSSEYAKNTGRELGDKVKGFYQTFQLGAAKLGYQLGVVQFNAVPEGNYFMHKNTAAQPASSPMGTLKKSDSTNIGNKTYNKNLLYLGIGLAAATLGAIAVVALYSPFKDNKSGSDNSSDFQLPAPIVPTFTPIHGTSSPTLAIPPTELPTWTPVVITNTPSPTATFTLTPTSTATETKPWVAPTKKPSQDNTIPPVDDVPGGGDGGGGGGPGGGGDCPPNCGGDGGDGDG